MKIIKSYFILEWKQSLKVLWKSFLSMIIMFAAIVVGVIVISAIVLRAQAFQIIDVAIVVPDEESQTKLVTEFVSSMDSVQSICKFQYVNEEEAMKYIQNKSVQVVVLLPADFYEDVNTGKNTPATIYFPQDAGLNVDMFRELLEDGASLLQTAQSGVYATLDLARTNQVSNNNNWIGNYIATLYIERALNRGQLYDSSVIFPIGEVNFAQYYFTAGVLFLLTMFGINFGYLYRKQAGIVEKKLRLQGLGVVAATMIKIIVMSNIIMIIYVLGYLIGLFISEKLELYFIWFDWKILLYFIPLAFVIASYFHIVLSLLKSTVSGVVSLLIINIGMIISAGMIIPSVYLPRLIRSIGSFMPINVWSQYFINIHFRQFELKMMLPILIMFSISIVIGVGLTWKNT